MRRGLGFIPLRRNLALQFPAPFLRSFRVGSFDVGDERARRLLVTAATSAEGNSREHLVDGCGVQPSRRIGSVLSNESKDCGSASKNFFTTRLRQGASVPLLRVLQSFRLEAARQYRGPLASRGVPLQYLMQHAERFDELWLLAMGLQRAEPIAEKANEPKLSSIKPLQFRMVLTE